MATHQSAIKRSKQNEKRRLRNMSIKSSVRTEIKSVTLALETKAEADLDNARRTVAQTVRSAFFGVQSTASQVQALEAAEASSQLALDANRTGYEVGVRINIDPE